MTKFEPLLSGLNGQTAKVFDLNYNYRIVIEIDFNIHKSLSKRKGIEYQ